MIEHPSTARDSLRHAAYATDDALRVRRESHARYSELPGTFHEWVQAQLPRHPQQRLLDVGSGPADFAGTLRAAGHRGLIVSLDLSEGMMHAARARLVDSALAVGDAQALPLGDATFDGVLARHMLYHVPDIPRALAEMARVLRPGGWLALTANMLPPSGPWWDSLWAAIQHPQLRPLAVEDRRFHMDNAAALLGTQFHEIRRVVRPDTFVFPHPAPVLAYARSMRALRVAQGHSEAEWADIDAQLAQEVARRWATESRGGTLRVPKGAGLLLARR